MVPGRLCLCKNDNRSWKLDHSFRSLVLIWHVAEQLGQNVRHLQLSILRRSSDGEPQHSRRHHHRGGIDHFTASNILKWKPVQQQRCVAIGTERWNLLWSEDERRRNNRRSLRDRRY